MDADYVAPNCKNAQSLQDYWVDTWGGWGQQRSEGDKMHFWNRHLIPFTGYFADAIQLGMAIIKMGGGAARSWKSREGEELRHLRGMRSVTEVFCCSTDSACFKGVFIHVTCFRKIRWECGEMAQWIRVYTTLSEDQIWISACTG